MAGLLARSLLDPLVEPPDSLRRLCLLLLTTLVKGRIVIDRFMALQGAIAPWRWVVLGWLVVVVGLIGYAFHMAQT